MQEKTTSELEQELSGCADLRGYLRENAGALRVRPLAEILKQACISSGRTRAEVVHGSELNPVYAYQIFSGRRHPGRDNLLCLCYGLGLNASQTQAILLHGGYGQLYVRDRRDSVIYYGLNNGQSVTEVNFQLEELGLPILGEK